MFPFPETVGTSQDVISVNVSILFNEFYYTTIKMKKKQLSSYLLNVTTTIAWSLSTIASLSETSL
jgi:hypothetical protein